MAAKKTRKRKPRRLTRHDAIPDTAVRVVDDATLCGPGTVGVIVDEAEPGLSRYLDEVDRLMLNMGAVLVRCEEEDDDGNRFIVAHPEDLEELV